MWRFLLVLVAVMGCPPGAPAQPPPFGLGGGCYRVCGPSGCYTVCPSNGEPGVEVFRGDYPPRRFEFPYRDDGFDVRFRARERAFSRPFVQGSPYASPYGAYTPGRCPGGCPDCPRVRVAPGYYGR